MVQFRIGGRDFELEPDDVRKALSGKKPERIFDYAVWVDGRWFPPKQALVTPIGLANNDLNSRQAYGILGKLGFPRHDNRTQGPLPVSPDVAAEEVLDLDMKSFALELAVQLASANGGSSSDALASADTFMAWLIPS